MRASLAGNGDPTPRFNGRRPPTWSATSMIAAARNSAWLLDRSRAIHDVWFGLAFDDGFVDHDLGDVAHRGQFVHGVEQYGLENSAQAARTGLALHGPVGHGLQRLVPELELSTFHVEQPSILFRQSVLGFGQDRDQRRFVQLIERRHDRQAADELGNQAVLDEVLGFDVVEQVAAVWPRVRTTHLGGEPDAALLSAVEDDSFQTRKRTTADKQDVLAVDLQKLLLRVLPAALRRDGGDGAFDQFQQRLLYAFAGDVTRDRGVV